MIERRYYEVMEYLQARHLSGNAAKAWCRTFGSILSNQPTQRGQQNYLITAATPYLCASGPETGTVETRPNSGKSSVVQGIMLQNL
jgi:hypothetical protein